MKYLRGLVFLCAGLLFLAGCRAGSPAQATLLPTSLQGTPAAALGSDIPRIAAAELWPRLQAGEPIKIVDARSYANYAKEHVAGAISLPMTEVVTRSAELAGGNLVVFYCT